MANEIVQTHNLQRWMLPLGSTLILTLSAGCSLFERTSELGALSQPISYRSVSSPNRNQNTPAETPPTKQDINPPSRWQALTNKTKEAIYRANRVILHSIGWVTAQVAKEIWDDILADDEEGFDPDPLWHQGYGFNNPNVERIKNGQPVLNFDGTVAR